MKILAPFFILLFLTHNGTASEQIPKDDLLKKMIGRMLIVGFKGESLDEQSKIVRQLRTYQLGGVILFDRCFNNKKETKNIRSPEQLRNLTASLRSFTPKPILIAVDQEGGKVVRLKPAYGFQATPSAKVVSELDAYMTKHVYDNLARTLKEAGINCNFAPVVDLALNPKNSVIVGLKRAYSKDPKEVVKYAEIFMNSLQKKGIVPVLKHFPGHGSSLKDSHKGFVDITETWSEIELEPYKKLLQKKNVTMIMTAHIFNAKLDAKYPATLSYKINTDLLRKKLGYTGVIISDDMQMNALKDFFSLKDRVTLAINSGVDMLLFGNQLAWQDTDTLIELIIRQIKNGSIPMHRIVESNERVKKLFATIDDK